MTAYEIELLLIFHCRAQPWNEIKNVPILKETLAAFYRDGLLEQDIENDYWKKTDRLDAYCKALQAVPLPTAKWITEWPKP